MANFSKFYASALVFVLFASGVFADTHQFMLFPVAGGGELPPWDVWANCCVFEVQADASVTVTYISGLWSSGNYGENHDLLMTKNADESTEVWILMSGATSATFSVSAGDFLGFAIGGTLPVSGAATYSITSEAIIDPSPEPPPPEPPDPTDPDDNNDEGDMDNDVPAIQTMSTAVCARLSSIRESLGDIATDVAGSKMYLCGIQENTGTALNRLSEISGKLDETNSTLSVIAGNTADTNDKLSDIIDLLTELKNVFVPGDMADPDSLQTPLVDSEKWKWKDFEDNIENRTQITDANVPPQILHLRALIQSLPGRLEINPQTVPVVTIPVHLITEGTGFHLDDWVVDFGTEPLNTLRWMVRDAFNILLACSCIYLTFRFFFMLVTW